MRIAIGFFPLFFLFLKPGIAQEKIAPPDTLRDVCFEGIIKPGKVSISDLKKASAVRPVLYTKDTIRLLEVLSFNLKFNCSGTIKELRSDNNYLTEEMKKALASLKSKDQLEFTFKIKEPEGVIKTVDPLLIKISDKTEYDSCLSNLERSYIYFDLAKSNLKNESKNYLMLLKKYLIQRPEINIEISGYADRTGTDKINTSLSYNRAKEVANFLINQGVSKNRITFAGYGFVPQQKNLITERTAVIKIIRP